MARPELDTDDVYDVLCGKSLYDVQGHDLADWHDRLAQYDLFNDLLKHIAERRHWPDYKQLVRLINIAIEDQIAELEKD